MQPPYQLAVDGLAGDLLRVQSLTGKEALSEVYEFEVVAVATAGDQVEQVALGRHRGALAAHPRLSGA